jgi:hypothetical protein
MGFESAWAGKKLLVVACKSEQVVPVCRWPGNAERKLTQPELPGFLPVVAPSIRCKGAGRGKNGYCNDSEDGCQLLEHLGLEREMELGMLKLNYKLLNPYCNGKRIDFHGS